MNFHRRPNGKRSSILDHSPPPQELHHQHPEPLLAVGQAVIAVREEVQLDLLKRAADGEVGDAPPGDGGVLLALQKEAWGAVAIEESVERIGAQVFDQGPAELAGDELVLEMDGPRLLPDALPLRSRPGEEAALQFQRRR